MSSPPHLGHSLQARGPCADRPGGGVLPEDKHLLLSSPLPAFEEVKSLSKLYSPGASGWLPPASWRHSSCGSCGVPQRVGDVGCCRAPPQRSAPLQLFSACPCPEPPSDGASWAATWHLVRTMPGERTPGRCAVGTAGGYFFHVSATHACVCFLTESCLGPETSLHSVQPVLGCEKTVVEGNFLPEHPSCGGVSEGREKGNKGQAERLQRARRGPKAELIGEAVRSE